MKMKKGGRTREGEVEEKWRGEEVDGKVSRVKYDREEFEGKVVKRRRSRWIINVSLEKVIG